MAYENGYNAVDYIGGCIGRYREDSLIFTKALQLVPVFMTRPDWPHCFPLLDDATALILGEPLSSVVWFAEKYWGDERIEWPDDIPAGFKPELRAFQIAVQPFVDQFWTGRERPLSLFSIGKSSGLGRSIFRFIRNDGQVLDIELNSNELKQIINAFSQALNQEQKGLVKDNNGD